MRKLLLLALLALAPGVASAQVLIPSSESQWNHAPFPPSSQDSLFLLQPEEPGYLRYGLITFSQLVTSGALTPNINLLNQNAVVGLTNQFVVPAGGAIVPENGFGPIGASPTVAGWLSFVDNKGVTRYISYH